MAASCLHPVFRERETLVDRLDRLAEDGRVLKRACCTTYTLYKYRDSPSVVGDARLARGLLVEGGRIVNLPLVKYDALVHFVPDYEKYMANLEDALPPPPYLVQPKIDGTCIHAVCDRGALVVHTFSSTDNHQVAVARAYLRGSTWREGLTLVFELVDVADPKVQQTRAPGLTLLAGADRSDGRVSTRAELEKLAVALRVPLVKQRPVGSKAKFISMMRSLDRAERKCEAL